ncbi:MAG TPA: hypothetical protein VM120_11695 [Bryobacteraceae bacterium]|nr:hypothetical protein [Bryobacteraceae bacterium]
MNLGAEPKKVALLGGLILFGAYTFYTNVLADPEVPPGAQKSTPAARVPEASPAPKQTQQRLKERKMMLGRPTIGEFRPSMKYGKEDRPDPMRVDPTLRLDLLARLQNVTLDGGMRSLFEIGTAPPPKAAGPDPKIDVKKAAAAAKLLAEGAKPPAAEVKPGPAVKPPPPPIPFKFYGFTSPRTGGIRRAFFLEGEEIHVVSEGETIKRRYKVVRIGLTSVVVEDTDSKNQQTLPLEEPPVTG